MTEPMDGRAPAAPRPSQPEGRRAERFGPSAESTLLTLAILFLVAVLLSTVTLIPRGGGRSSLAASSRGGLTAGSRGSTRSKTAAGAKGTASKAASAAAGVAGGAGGGSNGASLGDGSSGGANGGGSDGSAADPSGGGGDPSVADGSGGGDSGSALSGGDSGVPGTAAGPADSGGGSGGDAGGGSGGGSDGAAAGGGGGPVDCQAGQNGGSTDTGVSGNQILLGAVTVDTGPGATFLQPEDVAMQAVASKVNNHGGICGRQIKLILHDSGWDAQTGASFIQNLVEGDKVFALVVNPDSEGLDAASNSGYIDSHNVPVIGTDGLLYSQYQDPDIWPIAASTVTAMHAIAMSQNANGATSNSAFSLVYETTYRFGREGANAYDHMVKEKTGGDIPGYVDPNQNPQCQGQFCGISSRDPGYSQYINTINTACGSHCTAGAVLLEPVTAGTWFHTGGRFGGAQSAQGGAGAAPQPLFDTYFANDCQTACDHLRLWTGFLPPIAQFASSPGVATYVHDMQGYSQNVDVDNQFAEGAYLGMRLAVDALTGASGQPDGLTRVNVASLLDSTSNYDIGLTVAPLSWSSGNHFAETTVHAFDESYPSGFGGWQYVQGSTTTDPEPTHI